MSTRAIAPIVGKDRTTVLRDVQVVRDAPPAPEAEPVEGPVEVYQPFNRDECRQEIQHQLRHNPHMYKFQCDSCQTHRYLWVIDQTTVEPRTKVFRAHQGGKTFDRSTEGYTEVVYFCRRCGHRDSMRITDREDFPHPSEVLDDDAVRSELGYIVGPGESPQS